MGWGTWQNIKAVAHKRLSGCYYQRNLRKDETAALRCLQTAATPPCRAHMKSKLHWIPDWLRSVDSFSPPPQSSHHTMKTFLKLICVCLFKTKLDKQLPNTFSWIHVICFRCFLFQFLTNVSFQKLRMRPLPRREIQKYRGAVCRQSNRECLNPLGMCERCCFGGGDLRGEIDQAAAKKLLLRCFHLGRPINHLAACKWPPHIELII